MPEFYYNSLYRQDSSSEEIPAVPIEEKDDIFDDNRNQKYPVGSMLGSNNPNMSVTPTPITTSSPMGTSVSPASTTMPAADGGSGPVAGMGTVGTQGTTTPSVSLPTTSTGCGGAAPAVDSIEYTQGYLRTQIGKRVRVQFLLGTGTFQDRTGVLLQVGISYIILRNEETNTNVLCDIYSIKFVDFFN